MALSRLALFAILAVGIVGVVKPTPPPASPTSTEDLLWSFRGNHFNDGAYPLGALLAGKRGALYGTTSVGGASDRGTVFMLTPPARGETDLSETVLWSFDGLSDGSLPLSRLIADKQGALYGTTEDGGANGLGVVFMLSPPTHGETDWTETVLWSFGGEPDDGAYPQAGLIADKQGALYGTTSNGGTNDSGTVFMLTPPAHGETDWSETVLWSFGGPNDGYAPMGDLIADKQGALYGTTDEGGAHDTNGTVFMLTPPAHGETDWTETVLWSFGGPSDDDGSHPLAGLIADKQGALYGTTVLGGSDSNQSGTVFKLTPPAPGESEWTETVLWIFGNGDDGWGPQGALIADERGALYGTTSNGGTYNGGTVFMLTPPAHDETDWTETLLWSFAGGHDDGASPYAGLLADKRGALYGTTNQGGAHGRGTVFRLDTLKTKAPIGSLR